MMGARMSGQALPLIEPDSPLVQSESRDGTSFEHKYGTNAGAIRADAAGRVVSVDKDKITVRQSDGKDREYELYDNFPYNRKTFLSNTSNVKVDDIVEPGSLLAQSNYTDTDGALAIGKNLRVAYIPWKGNFEDAIVISESAAKKLTSEHMYSNDIELEEGVSAGRDEFSALFPTKYSKAQLSNISSDGVIKPGATVRYGDPLILASKARKVKPGDKLFRRKTSDRKNKNLFKGVKNNSYFYFAHSYYCKPKEKEVVLTTTTYGNEFVSSLHKDNVWAVQFHPEKSQKLGLKVFNNFLKIC